MNRFSKFVFIGLAFSSIGEYITSFIIKFDPGSFIFAETIYFLFLIPVFHIDKYINKIIKKKVIADAVYFIGIGLIFGLFTTEWLIVGNTIWNPNTSTLISQFSMFMFHGTTYFAPRLFLDERLWVKQLMKSLLMYFVPFFTATIAIGYILPPAFRLFWMVVLAFYIGYNLLLIFYFLYFKRTLKEERNGA